MQKPTALKIRGFTLVELLIVVVILGIVVSYAAPGYRQLIMKNQTSSFSEELIGALSMARLEAVKRKVPVSICRSTDGASCADAGDWADGFIIYVDDSSEVDTTTSVATDGVLKVWSDIHPNLNITLTRNDTEVGFVRYTSLGTSARIEDFDSIFTINVNGCEGVDAQRQVVLRLSGTTSTLTQVCPSASPTP